MILKAGKFRRLAALVGASLLLSSCGMIIDEDSRSPFQTAAGSTSSQTAAQTGTASSAGSVSSSEQFTSADTQPASSADSGSQTAPATTATTTAAESSAARTLTSAQSSAARTTAAGTTTASSAVSVTSGEQSDSVSKTTTTTTAAVKTGKLTESDQAFLADCVFVGDSICSGLSAYKILSASHVVAKGSVGVRSIFDYTFKVSGGSYGVVQALSILKPKYVIFSMGMNDINMTSAQKYCENYKNLLTKVQDALPSAKLTVASITPITTTSKFSTNKKIDSYNVTIRDYLAANYPSWGYVDIASPLKNEWNALRSNYTSGDGIHLSPAAYQVILSAVCKQLAP